MSEGFRRTLVVTITDCGTDGWTADVKDNTAGYGTGGDGATELEAIREAFGQYLASRGDLNGWKKLRSPRATD